MDTGSICISAPRRETDGRKRVFGRVPVPPENSVRGSQRPIGSFGSSPPARRPNLRFGRRTLFLRSAFAKPDTRVPVCGFRPRTKKWPREPKSAFLCPHSAFLTRPNLASVTSSKFGRNSPVDCSVASAQSRPYLRNHQDGVYIRRLFSFTGLKPTFVLHINRHRKFRCLFFICQR